MHKPLEGESFEALERLAVRFVVFSSFSVSGPLWSSFDKIAGCEKKLQGQYCFSSGEC